MSKTPIERLSPRITANELALYMVSSDTARIGIIRRSKYPQTAPIIRYRDVRPVICIFLSDAMRSVNPLILAEDMFVQRASDSSESAFRQDDAKASIEVIHSIQKMKNKLGIMDFTPAPSEQNKLVLSKVDVSVRADLIVKLIIKGQDASGAAILRLTQDTADTEAAKAKRREMGLYVATLARLHSDQNLQLPHTVANRACMSIDVQHGDVFQAPDANTRRMTDLDNACRFIAAMWDSTTP